MKRIYFLLVIMSLIIISCSANKKVEVADIAEDYIRALASKDKALITNLSCKEWEESAILEVDALLSVETAVKNLSCEATGEKGADTLVVCSGSLDLTYNDEIRGIDLSRRTYSMRQEDGRWRVCSYE